MGEVEVLLFPTDSVTRDVKSPIDQEVTGSGLVDSGGAPSGDEVPSYDQKHLEDHDEEPETNSGAGAKKKGCRRKKRRYKPYYKLSWQERRELEEREARRANRFRARMFAHGQPVAPYNTTQFLMEDHNVQEPNYEHITNGHRHRDNSVNSLDSSEEYYSSPEDEEDFLQKQFSEVYDDIHAERLSAMSKTELVQEYLILEDRVEVLESQVKEAKANAEKEKMDSETQTSPEAKEELLEKISIFKEEIRRLVEENKRLRRENEALREVVSSGSVSS